MSCLLPVFLLSLIAGPATCSVLGRECPTEITCEPIDGCEEANVYETQLEFEGLVCLWCPVCIDTTTLDSSGCPDREEMCQGTITPPDSCKAQLFYTYNDNTCNYCDEDLCVNFSNDQFVGSN
ncbi:uncharacterized protein LOC132729988 [Ruditapes philippinarum]|uniref:uncharacterized protein LOC132729988 n=1 Tax=Ruditapes philippinarum TaxID=129788 RepID=UPI00295B048B|nr:uncharacterized protein LOC132729988 [Ruditapes philippinarum]